MQKVQLDIEESENIELNIRQFGNGFVILKSLVFIQQA